MPGLGKAELIEQTAKPIGMSGPMRAPMVHRPTTGNQSLWGLLGHGMLGVSNTTCTFNFLSSQPDLNLHNPEVQDACLKVAEFWLDRGVDGFRLDAINYGMHHPSLSNNPVASPEHWDGRRPVNMQQAQYNSNQEGMTEFLERLRALLDRYEDRFTVAEVGGFDANRVMKSYTQGDARLNTAYSFHFLNLPEFDAEAFGEALQQWSNDPSEGWPSWAFSNHDVPRVASRWGQQLSHRHRCELAALVLISLRGNIFIYQGEELGLTQATIDFEHLQDPEAISNWPHTLGRDGARVPMPWNADQPNNGFSDCSPWLPMPGEYQALSVTEPATRAVGVVLLEAFNAGSTTQ